MKSNYSFNAELISNKKFNHSQIEKIKTGIEAREDFSRLYSLLSDSIEINFNGYLEIYIEDISFDLDISAEIEKMIEDLDSIISGGWSNDSKIEFYTEHPVTNIVWYKEGKEWKNTISNSPKSSYYFGSSSWEDEEKDEEFLDTDFLDYNKDYEEDENW